MSEPAVAPVRAPRFGMLWYRIALVMIALEAVFPVFLLAIGAYLANEYGCTINEGNTTPCLIDGTDWGETRQFFGLAPLNLIASFPIAMLFVGIWVVVLPVHRGRWRRRIGSPS